MFTNCTQFWKFTCFHNLSQSRKAWNLEFWSRWWHLCWQETTNNVAAVQQWHIGTHTGTGTLWSVEHQSVHISPFYSWHSLNAGYAGLEGGGVGDQRSICIYSKYCLLTWSGWYYDLNKNFTVTCYHPLLSIISL